jgi:hypothetical protein
MSAFISNTRGLIAYFRPVFVLSVASLVLNFVSAILGPNEQVELNDVLGSEILLYTPFECIQAPVRESTFLSHARYLTYRNSHSDCPAYSLPGSFSS